VPKLGKFSTSLPSPYRCYGAIAQIHLHSVPGLKQKTLVVRPVFPAERIVPPLRIARRGEVIFLGSRNNFPNPPFQSSCESNLPVHARHRKFVTRVPRTCCMLKMRSGSRGAVEVGVCNRVSV